MNNVKSKVAKSLVSREFVRGPLKAASPEAREETDSYDACSARVDRSARCMNVFATWRRYFEMKQPPAAKGVDQREKKILILQLDMPRAEGLFSENSDCRG
jgi:hypothetical protein